MIPAVHLHPVTHKPLSIQDTKQLIVYCRRQLGTASGPHYAIILKRPGAGCIICGGTKGDEMESVEQPYHRRVISERDELSERLVKLNAFLGGTIFAGLDMAEQTRLIKQADIMKQYLDVLNERIAAF